VIRDFIIGGLYEHQPIATSSQRGRSVRAPDGGTAFQIPEPGGPRRIVSERGRAWKRGVKLDLGERASCGGRATLGAHQLASCGSWC
jgi:hypothetical protein